MKTSVIITTKYTRLRDNQNYKLDVFQNPGEFMGTEWKTIKVYYPDDASLLEIAKLIAEQIKPHLTMEYPIMGDFEKPFINMKSIGFNTNTANKLYLLLFGKKYGDGTYGGKIVKPIEQKWLDGMRNGKGPLFEKSATIITPLNW